MKAGWIIEKKLETCRRILMVGGFLGAGKTTLISNIVRRLMTQGVKCGVVTNDQGAGLVDTELIRTLAPEMVSEISGGCFCCRLEELVKVFVDLEGGREATTLSPDVIVAEPVGSCTDLVSTVIVPLQKIYRVPFLLSPLSVVVDGRRALASLGGRRIPGSFSKDVSYIYRKQLEEAEIVVVNKTDIMEDDDLTDLLEKLEMSYPGREVFPISAKTGRGVDAWLERVLEGEANPASLMEMDYIRYGAGEKLLGWLNAEVELETTVSGGTLDGDEWLLNLAIRMAKALEAEGSEIAHFKMALRGREQQLGTVNQTMNGSTPEISRSFEGNLTEGVLTINLRAEEDPQRLKRIVTETLHCETKQAFVICRIKELASFRPSQPQPTFRVKTL